MKRVGYLVLLATIIALASCNDSQQAPAGARRLALPVVEVPVRTVTGYSVYPVSIEGKVRTLGFST